ncbi:Bck1p [Rhizophagus irregularis DAOM 197198w]|uniref:Bck1p n=1 Tax=Rhizophagus irregularis (strain DAOM 197198w) TaxID=1432141 RepID=A0A015KVV4_RHIIW|nr:Bck1p [Rhizophagus irregularis DAOM 197198w]
MSDDMISRLIRIAIVSKGGIKCKECKKRKIMDENHETCQLCYEIFRLNLSGNEVIDDIIRNTRVNFVTDSKCCILEFVPYDQFKNIEFIAEGGFSKIYKAIWVDGPISEYLTSSNNTIVRNNDYTFKVYYQILSNGSSYNVIKYFGITQDPITKDMMIIMPYYSSGDLIHHLSNNFYNVSWITKLVQLYHTISGLLLIHRAKIIHRDLHSGNILFDNYYAYIGDLGISRSATDLNNDNEKYGIIPYMAPEIFQGQKYTEASDIYSFGMIMWEFMTGRRPLWDEIHDIELIIKICDGLRPPIVTNAPEGYIELMKECWHSDPEKRPTADNIFWKIYKMCDNERYRNQTKIIKSSNIGPVTINNPGAIYKSRPLSCMIQSAISLRSSRSLSIDPFYYYQKNTDKRKLEDDSVEESNDNEQSIKRRKFIENENENSGE